MATAANHFTDPNDPADSAGQLLATATEELALANEKLRVANELQLNTTQQLQACQETIRGQAEELRQFEQAVRRLTDDLSLLTAGLTDTIADSLQATEFARADAEAQRLRLHRLVAEAPAMIAVLTGPGQVVELANEGFSTLFGHRQLVGLPVRQAVPELADQPFFAQLDDVYRTGETYTGTEVAVEVRCLHPDQPKHRFITYIFQATHDGAGHIDGLLIFAYEVTEQVRARQEREANARRRQLVTDALPVLIAYVDQTQRYQFNNQAYEGWFHQAPAALRGQRVRDVVGEAAYAAAAPYIARALAGERVDFEARMTYRDDLVKHIRTCFIPDVQQEQVMGFFCLISDVTEQVVARAEIERQRQQLHDLFRSAPMPILILAGPALVFELVNFAYQQLFPGRELLGKPLLDALPELADTAIPGLCRQVYDTGQPYTAKELPLLMARHAAGPLEEIYWTFTVQARRNEQGVLDGVIVFAYDVTDPVRARQAAEASQQQVQALNQHLTRTNEDLDIFVYTASHDLQGPLNNLGGLLQLLVKELPLASQAEPVARIFALMQDSLGRFQHTLKYLSGIAQLTAEADQPPPAMSLADVVRDILLDLALPIAEAQVQISVELAACPTIEFPEKHLRSVVYNLLSNAIKYRHPDRAARVWVRTEQTTQAVVLEVRDNGLGISPAQQARLFGLFQRLHTHVEGAGVGLYISKRLVENAGGTITVESQLGIGTTFIVTLPVSAP